MALISLGKIDKTIIYPLIPIVIMLFENKYFDYLDPVADHKTEFNIIQSISKFMAIIPFIIFNLQNKISNIQHQIDNILYNKKYYEKYGANKLKKFGFIVLINVLNLIFKMTYYRIINYFVTVKIFSWYILDIILITLFSFLILKAPVYKHQYLSIIIIVVAGIILNSIHHEFDEVGFKDILVNIFGDSVYSLMIVLKRYVMVNLFCSAYEIVFYEGVFSLVFFSVLLIILTNVEIIEKYESKRYIIYEDKTYIDNFYSFIDLLRTDKTQILISFIILIYYIPYYLFFNITIKNNSVFHVLLILLAEEGYFFDYGDDAFIICMNILLSIILLFMFLVFVEILELNFCGLSVNLKRKIAERAEIEANNDENIDDNKKEDRDSLIEMEGQTIDFNNSNPIN